MQFSVYSGNQCFEDGSILFWTGRALTAGGAVSFFPTMDGTSSGRSLFSAIHGVMANPAGSYTAAVAIPNASITTWGVDLRQINARVTIGRTLLVLGDTMAFAPDGTMIQCCAFGIPY